MSTVQEYHPATGAWSSLTSLPTAFYSGAAIGLTDGRALLYANNVDKPMIYNPSTGSTITLTSAPANLGGPAVQTDSDHILFTGGSYDSNGVPSPVAATYTLSTGAWQSVAAPLYVMDVSMNRSNYASTVENDGTVVFANSYTLVCTPQCANPTSESYNPTTNIWQPLPPQADSQSCGASLVSLGDGRILSAGGTVCTPDYNWQSTKASIYDINAVSIDPVLDPASTPSSYTKTVTGSKHYVALGDSVAAGEGINYHWVWLENEAGTDGKWVRNGSASPNWEPQTDNRPEVQGCHRSNYGYPFRVAADQGWSLTDLSCTGAGGLNGVLKGYNLDDALSTFEGAQLGSTTQGFDPNSAAYDSALPDVVSLTVGADDVHFNTFLRECYNALTSASCGSQTDTSKATGYLAQEKTNLHNILSEIKWRGEHAVPAKVPTVLLTTYFDPFPDQYRTCADIDVNTFFAWVSNGSISWLKARIKDLNNNIRNEAASFGNVRIVDIQSIMGGHRLCSSDPWVYGPSILTQDSSSPAPFHPTPFGQRAIAQEIEKHLTGL